MYNGHCKKSTKTFAALCFFRKACVLYWRAGRCHRLNASRPCFPAVRLSPGQHSTCYRLIIQSSWGTLRAAVESSKPSKFLDFMPSPILLLDLSTSFSRAITCNVPSTRATYHSLPTLSRPITANLFYPAIYWESSFLEHKI